MNRLMRRAWWLAAVVLMAAACSDTASTTAPVDEPSATTTTATSSTTTTPPPPPPVTTTTLAPTTTLDRVAEVEAIITDLEARRLDALFREDEEAFRALFANDGYLEVSLEALGTVEFIAEPSNIQVEVTEVLADTPECLAVVISIDATSALGPSAVGPSTVVLERTGTGVWGYSYVGSGWTCDGPHPLSG